MYIYTKFSKKESLKALCFLFCANQPEVEMPGPRRDHVVSDSVLLGTVLIMNVSVALS